METCKIHRWELHKNIACSLEQVIEAILQKTAFVGSPTSHLTNRSTNTNEPWCMAGETKINSPVIFSYGQWMIEMDGKRELGKSALLI